ncbi:frigida-LIKE protein, partial [Trifolium pratense]
MCSSKHDATVKKKDTTTLPVKRVFGNNNSLCGPMKKSMVSPTLYDHNDDDDDYDVPLSKRLSRPSSLGMCSSSKRDASVKKRDTTTLPVKRVFDNKNSLCGSMKKSKVSPTLYDHNGDDDDNDDVPLSKRLSHLSSLVTCSTKQDSSVKKSDTTKVPVKRLFHNSKSLCGSMKKPMVSPTTYDDNDDDGDDDDDDVPISSIIKMPAMSTDKSFSSLKKDIVLVENSFEECKRMRQEEETRLQSIKKDIEKFSKELENKKIQVGCVRRINEIHKKLKGKIEECVKDFVAKEGKLYLMEELIGERKQELRQVMDNISKRKHFETKVKEFESKEKRFEMKVKEMVMDLVSMQAHFDSQVKELESNKKEHERRVKDHESKVREFETQVKELESKKKHFERHVEKLKPKERQLRGQVEELESKEKQLDSRVKEFESKKDKFEGRVKELESGKKHFERRLK